MEVKAVFQQKDWVIGRVYSCIIEPVKSTANFIKSIAGGHQWGQKNDTVRALSISNSKLRRIPANLKETFPNLKILEVSNCDLKEITAKDLEGLENLEMLDLSNNQLKTLPRDLFLNMEKLRVISFSNNLIEDFSSDMLIPSLHNLIHVDFTQNASIDKVYSGEKEIMEMTKTVVKAYRERKSESRKCKPTEASREAESTTEVNRKEIDENLKSSSCESLKESRTSAKVVRVLNACQKLWETRNFSDFTIIAKSKQFKVHKAVLSVQSEVFYNLMSNNKMEQLDVGAYSPDTVENFLHCIYTGELWTEKNPSELLALVRTFKVSGMRIVCENLMIRSLREQKKESRYRRKPKAEKKVAAEIHSHENNSATINEEIDTSGKKSKTVSGAKTVTDTTTVANSSQDDNCNESIQPKPIFTIQILANEKAAFRSKSFDGLVGLV